MKRGLRVFALAAAVALALVAVPAAASDDNHSDGGYLALGDSYAFAYSPVLDPRNAANFRGYADLLAQQLGLSLTNAACPGESSGSMISGTPPDNGCHENYPPLPLHVSYAGSQLAFALQYLNGHHHIRLITLQIGGNDLLILVETCANNPVCIQNGLGPVLASMGANLDIIYNALRENGDYEGTIVAVPYFSFNYNDPAMVAITGALDGAEALAAARHGARVADAFDAFKAASAPTGVPCFAGLQVVTTPAQAGPPPVPPVCDIHPSAAGHAVYAQAVLAALPRHHEDD